MQGMNVYSSLIDMLSKSVLGDVQIFLCWYGPLT